MEHASRGRWKNTEPDPQTMHSTTPTNHGNVVAVQQNLIKVHLFDAVGSKLTACDRPQHTWRR